MDLLEGWIGPYVHQALTLALQWKVQSSQSLHPVEDPEFEDDGSNLRVKCIKKGVVQFTKIEQVTSPIHVWISDSQAYLKVTISAPAAEHFKRTHRKQITQGTLGGIFQLTNFEIVAQHHGPKKTKITMLIHELSHIGSDGSCAFGRPRPIECLEDIQELLDEFHAFRAQDAISREASNDLALPKRFIPLSSRTSSISSLDTGEDLSQAAFATQVPHLGLKKRARAAADAKSEVRLIDTDQIKVKVDLRARSPASSKGLISDVEPHESIGNKPTSATDIEPDTRCEANAVFSVGGSIGREDLVMQQTVNPTGNDGLSKQKIDLLSLLAGKTKPRTLEVQIPAVKIGLIREVTGLQKPATPPEASVNKLPPEEVQPQRAPILPTTESKDLEIKDFDVLDGHEITNASRSIPKAVSRKPPNKVTKPLRNRHRIGRKEVRISKDQRDLLERPDAWLPPEPGYRAPTANLPIAILEALNTSYDQRADSQTKSQKDEKRTSPRLRECSLEASDGVTRDVEEGSESDVPLSTSEWPPSSPQQPVLPPDSSFEAAEQSANTESHVSNREAQTNIDQAKTFSRTSRRLSTASSSSASDIPGRRRLVRGLPPRRGSARIDLSSSESLLRRNPERNFRPRDGSLTDPPDTHDDAEEQQSLEPNSVLPKPQQLGITASLRSADSSKSEMSSGRSNPPSASMNFINSTQVPAKEETYTDLPLNLHHRIEPRADRFDSSGLLLSDEESELETTLPHGLEKSKDLSKVVYAPQLLPSTALPKTAPVIQVKQTPYVNGRPNGGLDRLDLLSKRTDTSLADQLDRSFSITAQSETNSLDTLSAKRNHDHINGKLTVAPSVEHYKSSPVQPAPEYQAIEVSSGTSMADHAVSSIEETVLPMRPPEEAQVPSTYVNGSSRSFAINPLNSKRNSEPLNTSPKLTKRLKAHFTRSASDVDHTSSPWQDPAVGGRQQRSEYLKSIRNADLADFIRNHGSNDPGGPIPKPSYQEEEIFSPASPAAVIEAVEESKLQAANEFPVLPSLTGSPNPGSITTASQAVQEKTQSAPDTDIQNSLLNSGVHPLESADGAIQVPSPSGSRSQDQATTRESHSPQITPHDVEKRTPPEVSIGSVQDPMVGAVEISQASSTQHVIDEEGKSAFGALDHATVFEAPEVANVAKELPWARGANLPDAEENMRLSIGIDAVDLEPLNTELVHHRDENLSLHQAQAPPHEQLESQAPKEDPNLFARFKKEYPDYTGNASHFGKICSKIENLARVDRMEHPSLWDDFIIRHKTDYPQYTSQCMEDALDPVPYERFYRDAIEEPKYTKRVVIPKTIHEVVPKSPSVSELGQPFGRQSASSRGLDQLRTGSEEEQVTQAWVGMPNRMNGRRSYSSQDQNQQPQRSRTPPVIPSSDRLERKRRRSPDTVPGAIESPPAEIKNEVVDLTEDYPEDEHAEPARDLSPPAPSAKRARRSLPWTASVEGESSTKIPKASPLKTIPVSSPIPAPLRQPQSLPGQPLQKRQRPDEAHSKPHQKAAVSSPSMAPPTFKNPLTRYNSAKEPATPSAPAPKSPKIPQPQTNGTPRQTQLSGYWVKGRDPNDEAPYRIFERANRATRPGQKNAFATSSTTVKTVGDQSSPERKSGKGWRHDPFSLFL